MESESKISLTWAAVNELAQLKVPEALAFSSVHRSSASLGPQHLPPSQPKAGYLPCPFPPSLSHLHNPPPASRDTSPALTLLPPSYWPAVNTPGTPHKPAQFPMSHSPCNHTCRGPFAMWVDALTHSGLWSPERSTMHLLPDRGDLESLSLCVLAVPEAQEAQETGFPRAEAPFFPLSGNHLWALRGSHFLHIS